MEATPIEAEDLGSILRRVGNVLIVVGAVDIAWTIYVVWSGRGYASGINVFAVIAGVLLRRRGLRTARIVRLSAEFMLATLVGLVAALPIILPLDLIRTCLRITPALRLVAWGALFVAVLALLGWVYRSLAARPVEAAIRASESRPARLWNRPRSGFIAGAALVALLAIVLPLSNRSEIARHATERARAQLGPDYRYFVGSLSASWSAGATRVRATVLAYDDSTIRSVDLEWRE